MRSGIIAARNRSAAADPGVCSFVTSEGMGGTPPSVADGGRVAPGCGMGGTTPFGDAGGLAPVVLGSGWGVTGSGMTSELLWQLRGSVPSLTADARRLISRYAGTEKLASFFQNLIT